MKLPTITLACGATLETALIPYHAVHLVSHYKVRIRFALTNEARKFVRRLPLEAISQHIVYRKNGQLSADARVPLHRIFSQSDLIVVYPATPRLIVDIHSGAIRCPVSRTVAYSTPANVVICPFIHPDLDKNIYTNILLNLEERGHTVLRATNSPLSWSDAESEIARRLELSKINNPSTSHIASQDWNLDEN